MMYPLVLELAATDAPIRVPVTVTCTVLGFSTTASYKWRATPACARDLDDAYLTNAAIDLHSDDPEFGYRLIADDLRDAGHQVCDNRVWRLCSDQRLRSVHSKKAWPEPQARPTGPRRPPRRDRRARPDQPRLAFDGEYAAGGSGTGHGSLLLSCG